MKVKDLLKAIEEEREWYEFTNSDSNFNELDVEVLVELKEERLNEKTWNTYDTESWKFYTAEVLDWKFCIVGKE